MEYVFLFPGQGAQYIGMGEGFYHADDRVRELFDTASEVGGVDLPALLFKGAIEELSVTDRTQIAMTTVNIAAAYYLQSRGIHPARVAGFSLGEYTALVIAGVLSAEDALRAVKMRGDIMERVSRTHDSDGERAGLIAVIGMARNEIEDTLSTHTVDEAFIAIHNSPLQIVIGGTPRGLTAAQAALQETYAQIIRLKVSGPFHTKLMAAAAAEYGGAIADIQFHDPVIPVYSNVSGTQVTSGAEMKHLCMMQLTQVVEWVREQQCVVGDSAPETTLLEVGPGRVLHGLWRALRKSYPAAEREQLPQIALAGTRENIAEISAAL